MSTNSSLTNCQLAFAIAGLIAFGPALAEKPSWAGGDKHGKNHEQVEERHADRHEASRSFQFNDDHGRVIHDYYGRQERSGKCPPGLAKKHNGCMPPGQAKQWVRGQPLPADLRYYDLPRDLSKLLPPPPPQHRYVQIAGDVLMIAIGTNMVIDAIEHISQ